MPRTQALVLGSLVQFYQRNANRITVRWQNISNTDVFFFLFFFSWGDSELVNWLIWVHMCSVYSPYTQTYGMSKLLFSITLAFKSCHQSRSWRVSSSFLTICLCLLVSSSKGQQNRARARNVLRVDHQHQWCHADWWRHVHLFSLHHACQNGQSLPDCSGWVRDPNQHSLLRQREFSLMDIMLQHL